MTEDNKLELEDSSKKEAAIATAASVDGFMTLRELEWLYDHANGNCVEIGSHKGRSALVLALKMQDCEGHLSCVDCWGSEEIYQEFRANLREHLENTDVVSPIRIRSVEAASQFPDNSLDFVFIDSSHEYQDTVEEIILWFPKLRSNGLLCGHDYGHPEFPGLKKAVDILCNGFRNDVDSIWSIQIEHFSMDKVQLFKAFGEQICRANSLQDQLLESQAAANYFMVQSGNMASELQEIKTQTQTQTQKLNRVKKRLNKSKEVLEESRNVISAMKSSKFWKMRSFWIKLKRSLGIKVEEICDLDE